MIVNSWKRTYVIVALCAIAAGLIYLALPISKPKDKQQETQQILPSAEMGDNILYRISGDQIETTEGWYTITNDTKWITAGETLTGGKSRFLGQSVTCVKNQDGIITQIETKQNLSVPARMRIILSANAETDPYVHQKIAISCEEAFWSVQDGKIQAHPPGAEIGAEAIERRGIFYPSQEGSALTLITPKGTTSYLGQLEVTVEDGGYSVVNEVAVETYVMGVVPSEMPGSYGMEAAKVQAVCARSYAYSQWLSSEKFAAWGAHVDDSTNSQVYGGVVSYDDSAKGVEATWGKVLTYEGRPISTNYFSTSCGYTANGQEVWSGGMDVSYQQGRPQYTEGDYGDLSTEEAFHAFIIDGTVESYDSHSPWFRWKTSLSLVNLQDKVLQYFEGGREAKIVSGNELVESEVSGIGTVSDIYVYERSETGMAKSLLLIGTECSVVVEGPMAIRQILGGVSVELANGEQAGERELLPSAFISLEKIKDTEENLVSIQICGGG